MKNNYFTLIYGAIIAIISIILDLILYLLDPKLGNNIIVIIVSFGCTFGLLYYVGIKAREMNGGYISWKKALTSIWIAGMIGMLITTGYKLIFGKYIDPSINKAAIEMQVKQIEGMRGSLGDVKADQLIEEILNMDFFSLKNLSFMVLGCMIISFFLAAIAAALVMKNNPSAIFEKYTDTTT